eukprot:CAMPEP_0201939780 /NCGR_PEP_ID=MMETSP0903-20130614/43907_1 /ASSEMBLY_ACC=CAM_ASM_000552 /TAXON_ID=420261 /ORGANISM="Thalassiosira antarctica, Strain CCMP982" /LENGTH=2217 /DNA_ID=CAMNT_0048481399 /DNA_START=64 /DNA_END=6717 /DNA_ORIENTATION=-
MKKEEGDDTPMEDATPAAAATAASHTEDAAAFGDATEKTVGATGTTTTVGVAGPAVVVAAAPVHLAGFADAISPAKKSASPSFWTAALTGGGGVDNATENDPTEKRGDDLMDSESLKTQPESQAGGETMQEAGENGIVVTPAAEAIMAAISTAGVATATLMEDVDEEEEDILTLSENEIQGDGDMEGIDPIDRAAREAAASLNQEALYSTYESNFDILRKERDELRRQLVTKDEASSKQSEEYTKLKQEMDSMKVQLHQKDGEQEKMRGILQSEHNSKEGTNRQLVCSQERTDRVEKEADGLRGEISRLTKSNEEYNALLSSMSTQHSKSSSEAIPLRLQVKRLEQELQAVTTHSNYLDGELASKNETITSLKQSHSSQVRTLRGEADQLQLSLEQRERDLTSARTSADRTSANLDRLQKKLYDKEMEFTQQKESLEQDLNQERELVSLKEQRTLLAEDQRASLKRELEELKTLAKEAAEEATKQADQYQSRMNEGIDDAVREVREEEQRKVEELQDRLEGAEEAKLQLEEDILSKNTPRKRIGGAPLAITHGDGMMLEESGDPLSLTDLYTRLASTEDELRSSQHANRKLKILIDRIHRDVAAKTPLFHQKQFELESALDELDVANERLDYARREVTDVRADNGDLELRNREMDRECGEFKRENVDLAMQVQSLLQRRSAESGDGVTFDDVQSMQQQNQKLLRNHHSMSDKIQELETKIRENPEEVELNQLRTEVTSLRTEREKQSKLVAGIVHQRDLYRALVAKNDAPLLGGHEQLALADARAEHLPQVEAQQHAMREEVATLKAEVSCGKHEQEALNARLARVDAHANELTTSNERLRGDLTTYKATAARLEIDVSHYGGKCERLESSLERTKAENESESRRKGQLEELLGKTQCHLEAVRGELAKKEQQYQQASSKMRLLEVQLQTSTSNETRMESDANSLRSEIARQETLLSSVQRIEASLTAKSEGELENLQQEVKRLHETKVDDATKHGEVVQKLEGKVADFEVRVKELGEQKEAATVEAAKANLDGEKLQVTIQELTMKLKLSEKELTAAKVKLGDVTIDTSVEEVLEAKVATLTAELESTKSDLAMAQKRIVDYQTIAKAAEEQVVELTVASTKYKDETTSSLKTLRQSEQSQRDAVRELTNDLLSHRADKEKAVSELKAKVDSLTVQLAGAKEDAAKANSRMESLTAEAKRYQLDATNANVNYERELALHAEARTALREARSSVESEQRLRESAEAQLAGAKADIDAQKGAWEASKVKLEESLKEATSRLEDMRRQNNLLHDQMTSLSSTVEKFQSDKASQLVGESSTVGDGDKADASPGGKQMSDLRELLRFKQSECTMLEADLASAKRASERERTAAELAKRSLEEARSELKVLRESDEDGTGNTRTTEREMDNIRTKLKSAEEQLVLIRESNTMLREESQKVSKKLSEVQSRFQSLKSSTAPQTERMKGMEVERASLVAEKDSLSREVDAWKNRVHSLVSKFNQIDPEEHSQALASVEKLKEELSSLKTKKEQADASSIKAKSLVTRLNKEISSQKASIGAFKAALEKTKKEKGESANSNIRANNKIAEAQAATQKAESGLKASKAEVEALNSRMTNFRKIMQKMQGGLKSAKDAEDKAKATEESLQKEIAGLKQKLDAANTAVEAAASTEAVPMDVAAASEKAKDAEKEAASVVEKTGTQQQANEKETQETKPSSPVPPKTTLSIKTKAQPEAKADVADKTTDTVANKDEPKKAVADTTVPEKKKGKKRKANTPKKNAAADSVTESMKAPPQKKAATLSVVAKKETPPVTEAHPVVESTKASPQKKAATQSAAAKKDTLSGTESDAAAESAKALISLAKGTQKKSVMQSTVAKKEMPSATTTSKKEEEMKLKMTLLKKRKAAAIAKKLEAEKKLAARKKQEADSSSSEAPVPKVLDKSPKESDASTTSKSKPKESTMADKSQLQAAPTTSLKEPLPSVPEQGGSDEATVSTKETTAAPGDKKDAATKKSAPKPMTFGSSATLTTPPMTFGVPKAKPLQSEPDCPKPSFFGASTSTSATFGGVASATASAFGGGAVNSKESKAQGSLKASGSGTFLNLQPPGKLSTTPGKFVFGKSANITLTAPSGSPMTAAPKNFASFGQTPKFGTSPFGGGFGGVTTPFGTSPFGGGDASKKRPLSTTSEEREEPETKQSRNEEGEITEDTNKTDEAAAESSKLNKDAAKEA